MRMKICSKKRRRRRSKWRATADGKVTLKGPVRTEQEKSSVEAKAAAVAGEGKIKSEIEIAPKKK